MSNLQKPWDEIDQGSTSENYKSFSQLSQAIQKTEEGTTDGSLKYEFAKPTRKTIKGDLKK